MCPEFKQLKDLKHIDKYLDSKIINF